MTVKLANISNPTDLDIMRETKEVFDEKIEELRNKNENKGQFLIYHNVRPWNKSKFFIGTKKDYPNYEMNDDEILLGEEI